ncbi:MAG TPA: BolA family protein [Alphaproteobacteria bacterium]
MSIRDAIERKLKAALLPERLDIVDESRLHAGHAGARAGGDSHFRVYIVARAFAGKTRIERQRLVNTLLADEFAAGLHALALTTLTPEEAGAR